MAILSTNPASILFRKSSPSPWLGAMPTMDDEGPVAPEPAAPQATAPTQADVDLLLALQWTAPADVDQA